MRRAVADGGATQAKPSDTITVELGGVTRFVARPSVTYAEAQGDYVRLYVLDGSSHLIRTPLGALAEEWDATGGLDLDKANAWLAARQPQLLMLGQVTAQKLFHELAPSIAAAS